MTWISIMLIRFELIKMKNGDKKILLLLHKNDSERFE